MKRIISIIMIVSLVIFAFAGCEQKQETNTENKMKVAVSILPQIEFVKAVGGDLVEVTSIIPPGASPTNYQPSPKEMREISDAKVYFSIGVPAEEAYIKDMVLDFNENVMHKDLSMEVDKLYPARYFDEDEHHHEEHEHSEDEDHNHSEEDHNDSNDEHNHEGRDPHIWMSPKRVEVMIKKIEETLVSIDAKNEAAYKKNAKEYLSSLNEIDETLSEATGKMTQKKFIIMHPSMGYFAEDYGLEMIALEKDGKESSVSHLTEVIEFAKKENIKVVLYQSEFDNKQGEIIANEVGGKTLEIQPLSENYLDNMKDLAKLFENLYE